MKKNIEKIQKNHCYGCQACSNVCPRNCIKMIEDKNGFLMPKVDNSKCVNCGLCINICPSKIVSVKRNDNETLVYAANVKDYNIRQESTSGGVFFPLAEYVIKQGGYVYGAAFDEDYNVVHICAENMDEVRRCMKSKYVQSNMNGVYKQIAEQSQTKLVMFTGTPCQIAALSNYPNVNRERLILVDLVCHGVPSPKLWKKYLLEKEKEYGKINKIKTRDKKEYGCSQSETIIQFANGEEYRRVLDKDEYMRAFMRGYSLRSSCYNCQFKGKSRKSDLTIGDFMSAAKYVKETDNFCGTSMIIANSNKGSQIIRQISNQLEVHRIYSKKPLIVDWTWGLSIPYKKQSEYFYDVCFAQDKSLERSLKKTELYLKKKEKLGQNKGTYEVILEIKRKIKELYYQYIFKL